MDRKKTKNTQLEIFKDSQESIHWHDLPDSTRDTTIQLLVELLIHLISVPSVKKGA